MLLRDGDASTSDRGGRGCWVAREGGWGLLLGRKAGLETLGKGPVVLKEGKGVVVKVRVGRVVRCHGGVPNSPKTPPSQQNPRIDPPGRQSYFRGDHLVPPTHSPLLHKQPMADQGSGGSRLPLALPSASQSCSSGGSGSSAGGSGNPPPPRNLQGLLQMAISAGSEDPDPPPEPMSEEVKGGAQEAG